MASKSNAPFPWPCPLTGTGRRSAHSTCAKAFAAEFNFQIVETSDDGNCFFYSLIKFGKRLNFAPLLLDVLTLRKHLVDHIEDNFDNYAPYLSNNNQEGTAEQQIESLRKDGVWASAAGDLVPVAATNAFNIPIDLYNIEDHGDQDVIRQISLRPSERASSFSSPPPLPLSILRVREGHFQLLWPRSAPSSLSSLSFLSSLSSQSRTSSSTKEVVEAAHVAVQAARVAVSVAMKVMSPSRASRASSLSRNEHNLNQITRHLNQLSFGKSPSLSPPPSSSSRRVTRSSRPSRSSGSPSFPSFPSFPSPSPPRRKPTTRKKKRTPSPTGSFYVNNNNNIQRAIEASLQ